MSFTIPKLATIGARSAAGVEFSTTSRTGERQHGNAVGVLLGHVEPHPVGRELRHHDEPVGERHDLGGHQHAEPLGRVGSEPLGRADARRKRLVHRLEARTRSPPGTAPVTSPLSA